MRNNFSILGKWNVDTCRFKIPGWHTDPTNSKYIFHEDYKLIICSENVSNGSISKSFKNDDKTITIWSEQNLGEINYEFRFGTEGNLELENDMIYMSLTIIK